MEFTERDASVDRSAAQEILDLTGQLGVPVTTDGSEVIAGFDVGRLKKMAARNRSPGLGLRVANHRAGGALVGGAREGSPGARAGLQEGDVIVELSGVAVGSVEDLETIAARWSRDQPTSMTILRGEERKTIILYR